MTPARLTLARAVEAMPRPRAIGNVVAAQEWAAACREAADAVYRACCLIDIDDPVWDCPGGISVLDAIAAEARDELALRRGALAALAARAEAGAPPDAVLRRAAFMIAPVLDADGEPVGIAATTRPREPGRVGLPGGTLLPGETAAAAARREAREEGWRISSTMAWCHRAIVDDCVVDWFVAAAAEQLDDYVERGRVVPIVLDRDAVARSGYGNAAALMAAAVANPYIRALRESIQEDAEMRNLTPHQIDIVLPDGSTVSIPPSGTVARIETMDEPDGSIVLPDGNAIPVTRTKYGALIGLDVLGEDEVGIVSRLVLDAARAAGHPAAERLVAPGPLVRDAEGRVIGCRGLAR